MISKEKLRFFISLKRKKVRDAEGRFIVEGLRTCEELIASNYSIETLLYCPTRFDGPREHKLISAFKRKRVPVFKIDEPSLARVSATTTAPGVLAIVRGKKFAFSKIASDRPRILLALDRIREPGNLGSIIRTACWFGAGAILLSAQSVEFLNPKVIRSSMGAVFHIPVFHNLDLSVKLMELNESGYDILAASLYGRHVHSDFEFSPQTVLLLGNEAAGLDPVLEALATETLHIPKRGHGESINVAVAAGIILAEMTKVVSP